MKLVEIPSQEFATDWPSAEGAKLPPAITSATWKLDLAVGVCFPKFIRSMSQPLIEKPAMRFWKKLSNKLTAA